LTVTGKIRRGELRRREGARGPQGDGA
jgi:hypothetical protein